MDYKFKIGQRVVSAGGLHGVGGTVTSVVPGNGSFAWYFVQWDTGEEDRYTGAELEAI